MGSGAAPAQTVNEDGTVGTTVTGGGPFTITGGTIQGNNLFHSFTDFSPAAATTTFDLNHGSYGGTASGITAIINRVTGSNVSNIDGLLQVLGGADPDFFLINPNGIVFGPNAQLDLNGSFIGSTASSIVFPGGVTFAASDTTVAPLLTVNRPLGLQMGSSPSAIQVNDAGQTLFRVLDVTDRNLLTTSPLQVATGKTLALLGGEVTLNGGVLTAEAGNIELGAAQNAQVNLSAIATGWTFDYSAVQSFGDVTLTQAALVDVSNDDASLGAGSAALQGADINLLNGSMLLSQNLGNATSGTVRVDASQTLRFQGNSATGASSVLWSETGTNTGRSSDITVQAQTLTLSDGAELNAASFGPGESGDVTVQVAQTLTLEGVELNNPTDVTSLGTITGSTGSAGNVTASAQNLNILNGASLGSFTFGQLAVPNSTGGGGAVNVTVTEDLTIAGLNPILGTTGGIGAVSLGDAPGGTIGIQTKRLTLRDGGRITTEIADAGNAGDLTITATEQILVQGTPTNGQETGIFASGNIQPFFTQLFFGLPPQPTGQSGNVNIQTPYLEVSRGGTITARNAGTGNSGNVNISGDLVYLNEGGNISTSTTSGEGGGINLALQDLLLLRRGGFISTEAGGTGNGGNIAINAPVIAGYENSDIIANAFQGNGGNINITTQGIFGLAFRDQLTPENDITASSQFGLNGTFTVNEFSLDPSSGLVALAVALSDASDQVDATCAASRQSEFIATGRGGVPPAPLEQTGDRPWQDTRDLSAFLGQATALPRKAHPSATAQLREATGFQQSANGAVMLVAQDAATAPGTPYATCATAPET
ncbi:MAG: filamentous hemagglutinin N-terminal domain-containing protein [Spirulinaceae cyanobacterium]